MFSTPWFDSGYMLGVSLRGLVASTLQKTADSPQLQFIEGSRHLCLYADAVPYVLIVQKTIEIPQLLVDTMADVPFVLVV